MDFFLIFARMMRYVLFILLFFGLVSPGQAQSTGIRGQILDSQSGQVIPFATIKMHPGPVGAISDEEGFFSIQIEPGDYHLTVQYLGYDSISVPVEVVTGTMLFQKIDLEISAVNLNTVEVNAQQSRVRSETNLATSIVSGRDLNMVPGLSTQGDLAQYLDILPGVVTSGEQGGQIYISGGAPHQNQTLIDGIQVINPFHSLRGFSVVPSEMTSLVKIKGAAFEANYGGRTSSVLDISLKSQLPHRIGGNLSIDPFISTGFAELPIWKSKEKEDLGMGLFISAKQSLIDRTDEVLYSQIEKGIPFSFQDFTAKLMVQGEGGNHLSFTALGAKDAVALFENNSFNWSQSGGALNFRLLPSKSSLVIQGGVSMSNFLSNLEGSATRESSYNHFRGYLNMSYFGQSSELNYGILLEGAQTDFTFLNSSDITFNQQDNTSDISAYLSYKYQWGSLILEPGLRGIYYASLGSFSFEPRLGLKYNLTDQIGLKGGLGIYSQNLVLARKDEDIVNFFNAFLSSPDGQLPLLSGAIAERNIQTAQHALLGMDLSLGNQWLLTIEFYVKKFDQLIELNRNKINSGDPDYSIEEGLSQGINSQLQYQTREIHASINYSWLMATRDNGDQIYPAPFDRRHQFTGLINYKLMKKWNFTLRWTLGSGFPFTRTQGFYDRILFEDGPDEDLMISNGELGILFEDRLNQGRLPYYHRLDFSVRRAWSFDEWGSIETALALINIYDRANIFYFDRIQYERVDQFPFIPSLGIKFNW